MRVCPGRNARSRSGRPEPSGGRSAGGTVAAVEIDRWVPERGEPGNVGRVERVAVRGEVVEGGLDVVGLPEHDDVDHDAEAVELVFLPGLVVLPELAALPVEDVAGQRVAAFAPAEQAVDSAAAGGVVDVFEYVQRLDHPAEFGQGTGEAGGAGATLQGVQDRRRDDGAGRAGTR